MTPKILFHQLPVGPMQNFAYMIGCPARRECVLVDPAWDVDGLLDRAEAEGYTVTGALVSHYHPDHCGGKFLSFHVPGGVAEFLERRPNAKIHVNKHEAEGLRKITGIGEVDMVKHDSGDKLKVGDLEIELIHTPGHTPGSQCFLVDGRLVSGDTLFLEGCGRVDLPGADPEAMFHTLTQKLARLPDEIELFPGHDYSDRPSDTLGNVKRYNQQLKIPTLDRWLRSLGSM